MDSDAVQHVHAFYEALAPGHREALLALQSAHIVYELPEGMPAGAGRFEGMQALLERFLPDFYAAFDARFVPEETIAQGDRVVVLGSETARVRSTGTVVDLDWVHVFGLRNGKVTAFQEFFDTAAVVAAMGAAHAAA